MDLSVVIPSYNSEKSIRQCIDSVVTECDSNSLEYEIIVVDDGSSDSSPEILKEVSNKNQNIIIINQNNSGPSVARNRGLEIAKGKYIAFNDSDDLWIQGKLKTQLDFLEKNSEIAMITGPNSDARILNEKIISFKDMAFHNYFITPNVIFRNIDKNIRFPINMKYSEDMRFFLTFMLSHTCYYIPQIFSRNYQDKSNYGESGLSSNLGKMEIGELKNIYFIYKNKKINIFVLIYAYLFSFLKFFRRLIISRINKFKKRKHS